MLRRLFCKLICLAVGLLLHPGRSVAQESTTVGGYGELHYNEPDGSAKGKLDFHRFVIYLGHGFNENLTFKSEIEIEHTKLEATENGGAKGGEVAIEQAYLDWHFNNHIGLRAGIILPPIGIINQFHEPPTFNGVERPNVDLVVIPTTWRESGFGIYGSVTEGLQYQLYVTAGLKIEGFSPDEGIRGGRQEALESSPMNPSLSGRLDLVPLPELKLGGSFFVGNTTGGEATFGNGTLSILSADVQYTLNQFSLRAVGASESIADAASINDALRDSTGALTSFIPDQLYGFYLEGAYNVMPWICNETDQRLSPFIRYEKYDTQSKVTGFTANTLHNRNEITVGATYKPTFNTVLKIDYQFFNNASDVSKRLFNLGIGYSF